MQVQCPRCQTKYNLDAALLDPEGSAVRCSRCGHEFTARPQADPEPLEAVVAESAPPRKPPPPPEDDIMDFLEDDGKSIQGLDLEDEEDGGKKRSPLRRILVYLLILILILGLLLGGVLFLKTRGINLDKDYLGIDLGNYLSFVGTKEKVPEKAPEQAAETSQDPGNKRIHLAGVEGSFLEVADQNQIFIIKGKIKNSYGHPVSEIKLRGILHTKDRRNAAEAIVFAGHLLSEEEIKSLSRSVIEGILSSPQLAEGEAAGVESGETEDFMIIFFDLPENLVEYTVEVVSSRSVQQ